MSLEKIIKEYMTLLNKLLPILRSGHYPSSSDIIKSQTLRSQILELNPNFHYPDPFNSIKLN